MCDCESGQIMHLFFEGKTGILSFDFGNAIAARFTIKKKHQAAPNQCHN